MSKRLYAVHQGNPRNGESSFVGLIDNLEHAEDLILDRGDDLPGYWDDLAITDEFIAEGLYQRIYSWPKNNQLEVTVTLTEVYQNEL